MKSEFKNLPSGWKVVRLGDVFEKITIKNRPDEPILTIKQGVGTILRENSDRQILFDKKQISTYKFVKKNDFIIHLRSFEGGFEMSNHQGIVSPAYIILRNKILISHLYFKNFFRSHLFIHKILAICVEGIRDGKQLNFDTVKNLKIPFPPLDEQEKIAKILSTWDEAINLTIDLIENKKQFKKALMQNLLTAKIRFPEFKDEWKEIKLGEILKEHKIKSDNKSEVFSVSVHKGIVNQIEHLGRSFSAEDTSNYNLVKPFDLVYTKSPTGDFPFGIIKQNLNPFNVIVSPLYGVFEPINKFLGTLLHYFFESSIRTNNYLQPIIQKGAKNTINISNDTFLSRSILVPINLNEQQKIAEVLTACDDEINLLNLKLENLKKQKQGLMQKLLSGKVRI